MEYEHVRTVAGRKGPLEILDLLSTESPCNYKTIEAAIDASTSTLSGGLELLLQYDLVTRRERSHKDVQYRITDDGQALLECCEKLEEFLVNGK